MKIRKKHVKRKHSGDTIKFKFQIDVKQLKLRFAPSSAKDLNSNVSTSSKKDPKNAECVDNCCDIDPPEIENLAEDHEAKISSEARCLLVAVLDFDFIFRLSLLYAQLIIMSSKK